MNENSEVSNQKLNLLLGVTGSVAAIKLLPLLQLLHSTGQFVVRVVSTSRSEHFLESQRIVVEKLVDKWYRDSDEWTSYRHGDPVLHIELRKWADVFCIAPLSANTLAKLSNGICDTLLTCVARAWDFQKPILVAPAMNTYMWEHPFTPKQLDVLSKQLGYQVVDPVAKKLACGDVGVGAMAEVSDICEILSQIARRKFSA
eukprot:ANDGO_08452.mRNA.1 Phosphopantothenoylcysteine decarboxylase